MTVQLYPTFISPPEPLGGVRNLQVIDPTTSTLNVLWEAAEGNVRQYRIFYVPAAGGEEEMVNRCEIVLEHLDHV